MFRRGVPKDAIRRLLGHHSLDFAAGTYVHLDDDDLPDGAVVGDLAAVVLSPNARRWSASGLPNQALAHQRSDLPHDLGVALLESAELSPEHDVDGRGSRRRDTCGSSSVAEESHLSKAVARVEGSDLIVVYRNARLPGGEGEEGVAAGSLVDQLRSRDDRLHLEGLGELLALGLAQRREQGYLLEVGSSWPHLQGT